MLRRASTFAALLGLATVLAACGGAEDETTSTTEEATTSSITTGEGETGTCTAVEEVAVESGGSHTDGEFTAADYDTNPPTGGDHNPAALASGTFYPRPQRLGEAVHLLEHGAVIGWTKELEPADQKEIEDAFNDVYVDGYYQLAVIENPELEVPFALSAWGFAQRCEEPDSSVIAPFAEEHYASAASAESLQACQGEARRLPACRALIG